MERKMHCHRDGAFFLVLMKKFAKDFKAKKDD